MAMAKIYLILLVLLMTSACQNAGSTAANQATLEPRVLNPEIVKRIDAKMNTNASGEFPKLSEMPREQPTMATDEYITRFETELLTYRSAVLDGILSDQLQTTSDRMITARMRKNGKMLDLSLAEAAEALSTRIMNDQVRVKRLMANPLPELGGVAPKDQR